MPRRFALGAARQNANVRPLCMVQIEHIALWAADIDRLCAFYERHFGARIGPLYLNHAKGFTSRFLDFGSGVRMEVMASTTLDLARGDIRGQRLGFAHIALSLGSEQSVDSLTESLRASGAAVLDGPRRTGDGYYESVVLDPEGNRIELTV
jgi:lactoylglutathione lyase